MSNIRHRERPSGGAERPAGHQIALRAGQVDPPAVKSLKEYVNAKQLDDPFVNAYGVSQVSWAVVQQPPYSFYALMKMPQDNSILGQCIDAMVTNVDGHGYRLEFTGEENDEEMSDAAKAEKKVLENLLDFPNDDYTLQELRDRVRRDFETIGNAYIEVGRDQKGRIVMMSHVPAHTIRMTNKEDADVEVEVRLPRDGDATKTRKVRKRFRRYVQMIGSRKVFFKEYGDPRLIDPDNGQVASGKSSLKMEDSATEIIHLCTYNPNSPYGLPRWFNQITSVLGTRQAEMVNLDFFRDNAIPAMMLLVSGGAVTSSSLDQIGDHFSAARGRASMNRVLVVEALGDQNAADNDGKVPPPKMEIKPLQGERQADATWQEYDKNGMDKIRSSFRLPPLFVGRAEDQTYATAKTSYDVAEGQVFAPERQRFDDMINLKILSTYDAQFWSFRSNPPRLSDKAELIDAVGTLSEVGALTPNVAIGIANELFDLEIKSIKEDWGDYPFPMVEQLLGTGKLKIDLQNVDDAPPPGEVDPKTGLPIPGAPGGKGGKVPPPPPPVTDPAKEGPDSAANGNDKPPPPPETAKQKVTRLTTRAMLDLGDQLRAIRDEAA